MREQPGQNGLNKGLFFMSDIEIAKKAQIQLLKKTIQELASLKSSETKTVFIETEKLQDQSYIPQIASTLPNKCNPGENLIYIFRIIGSTKANQNKIYHNFTKLHKKRDGRALCKNNEKKDSDILYIGSSKNLRARFKQHLGDGPVGTYAMHMKHWINGINLKIEFTYHRFSGFSNNALQALEDGLWDRLKPMFGKRGAK